MEPLGSVRSIEDERFLLVEARGLSGLRAGQRFQIYRSCRL